MNYAQTAHPPDRKPVRLLQGSSIAPGAECAHPSRFEAVGLTKGPTRHQMKHLAVRNQENMMRNFENSIRLSGLRLPAAAAAVECPAPTHCYE